MTTIVCRYFQYGKCVRAGCRFAHVKADPNIDREGKSRYATIVERGGEGTCEKCTRTDDCLLVDDAGYIMCEKCSKTFCFLCSDGNASRDKFEIDMYYTCDECERASKLAKCRVAHCTGFRTSEKERFCGVCEKMRQMILKNPLKLDSVVGETFSNVFFLYVKYKMTGCIGRFGYAIPVEFVEYFVDFPRWLRAFYTIDGLDEDVSIVRMGMFKWEELRCVGVTDDGLEKTEKK